MYSFRIKELRDKVNMTQHELSVKCNIQLSTLRNIEKNRVTNIKTSTLFKLKEVFSLNCIDELFYISDDTDKQ